MTFRTLRSAQANGEFVDPSRLVAFAAALSSSMVGLHQSGIVLGALDPDSVALDSDGSVRLRPTAPSPQSWMSPERRGGVDTGIVGDSYLWGAAVTYAATGGAPQPGTSPLAGGPEPLASLVARALSAAPGGRPSLTAIAASLGVGGHGATSGPRRGMLMAAILGLVVAVALGVGAVVFFIGSSDGGERPVASDSTSSAAPGGSSPPAPTPTAAPTLAPTPSTTPSPRPTRTAPSTPQPPPGAGIVAPSGTSFFGAQGGPVRCAYFPEGTAGQVIACIDDQSETLVRLNAGMIRVTVVTLDQSVQVPRTGPQLAPGEPAWLYGTKSNGSPLFECWGVPSGIACRDKAQGDWFVMGPDQLKTSK